jgi:hypothetical protein
MEFLRELLEGDDNILDFAAAKRRRAFRDKWSSTKMTSPDDIPEPLRRAAADLKASRAAVFDFDAAKQRKMDQSDAGRLRKAVAHLKTREPFDFPERPKASVSKLPLRSRDDIAKQTRKVMRELDTTFTWIDEYTAMAHYNPADYIRAVNAFDQLFGSRQRTGRTAYIWHVDDVTVTFTLETRKIIIEIE